MKSRRLVLNQTLRQGQLLPELPCSFRPTPRPEAIATNSIKQKIVGNGKILPQIYFDSSLLLFCPIRLRASIRPRKTK